MSEARLPGLVASTPLGFMAALGLLRVLGEDRGLSVGLRWDDDVAVVVDLCLNEVLAHLTEHLRGRARAPEFNLQFEGGCRDHVRELTALEYRRLAERFGGDRRALDFLSGYGTDTVLDEGGMHGRIARTQLDMTSGQQKFLAKVRELGELVDDSMPGADAAAVIERLRTGLLGGPPEPGVHSLGWEPIPEHAHHAQAPTHMAPLGHAARLWLAVEALACHPVLPITPQRARTVGFGDDGAYWWPTWTMPASISEARLLRLRPVRSLGLAEGISGLWRAERRSVGKYGCFRPAARTRSNSALGEGPRSQEHVAFQ